MGEFDALGDDLVLDILSRLKPADIILKAGRVCKQWRRLARSQELRELVARRTAGDPDPDPEPWFVLQRGHRLLLYPSLESLFTNQGWAELDHGSFSVGPPGHRFILLACALGLVCGRLEDLDEAGGEAMTLAVGNPLTNAWRFLPRIHVKEKPRRYFIRVKRSGHYHVMLEFEGFDMDYHSKSKDWEACPPRAKRRKLSFIGSRKDGLEDWLEGRFALRVRRRSRSRLNICLGDDGYMIYYWGLIGEKVIFMEEVSDITFAFVPSLAVP
ncbi:uncharacterized protein LOC112351390 [Selaginella moellendorffii]|uniref:uncharacterized protein LOC112351390 n=1 Tax=Selaginella moellendorffii TaxID=88036 RepID=UPI000D1C5D46|nr:uncharacterized protein LOC112351390 [Selaginella moellendorffii]|eukprot:XP_024545017.1 uncharacterized protein LOC112351390 [Selaginella moellendorffii]